MKSVGDNLDDGEGDYHYSSSDGNSSSKAFKSTS